MKTLYSILIFILLCIPMTSHAEAKEIISEGTYNMGDGETPAVAESRAMLKAKQIALEQAGTYVESHSKVEGIVLTKDEIQVLASGLMEVEILDKKRSIIGDGINFWIKIKATVNPVGMKEMADRVKEQSLTGDFKKLQQAYDHSREEVELLKQQLVKAQRQSDRAEIQAKITKEEKLFQAKLWYEKGDNYYSNGDLDQAVDAFTEAIFLNPKYVEALNARGFIYEKKDLYDNAIEDFTKVIKIRPEKAYAYYHRGFTFLLQDQCLKAITDFNKAIDIDSGDDRKYLGRGLAYISLREYVKAIADFGKVISLNPKRVDAYVLRGKAYTSLGSLNEYANGKADLIKGIDDLSSAIKLDPNNAMAYGGRGLAYGTLKNRARCLSDLQKACDLGDTLSCQAFRDSEYVCK